MKCQSLTFELPIVVGQEWGRSSRCTWRLVKSVVDKVFGSIKPSRDVVIAGRLCLVVHLVTRNFPHVHTDQVANFRLIVTKGKHLSN